MLPPPATPWTANWAPPGDEFKSPAKSRGSLITTHAKITKARREKVEAACAPYMDDNEYDQVDTTGPIERAPKRSAPQDSQTAPVPPPVKRQRGYADLPRVHGG